MNISDSYHSISSESSSDSFQALRNRLSRITQSDNSLDNTPIPNNIEVRSNLMEATYEELSARLLVLPSIHNNTPVTASVSYSSNLQSLEDRYRRLGVGDNNQNGLVPSYQELSARFSALERPRTVQQAGKHISKKQNPEVPANCKLGLDKQFNHQNPPTPPASMALLVSV